MCTEILVKRDGKEIYCDTVGSLADALAIKCEEVSSDPAENCLCNANIERLCARRASKAEGWPFPEYVIEWPPANALLSGASASD